MSTSFYAQTAPTKAPPSQKNTDATGEPSLAETLGWIQQKLTTGAGMYSKADKTRIKIDGVRVDDCTITYNEFFDSDGAGGDVDTSFQLKDIDPSSIKVEDFLGGFVVRYNTLDSKQAINRSGRKVDKGFIAFQEQDLAARFARALTHAIKLCAGKREPF
ncbi:MAG TPA: hypothetical protein VFA15_05860 [Nitrososphaera sp.]|nr:hypothetical protein [Nitrososphaera sp.]